MARFQPSEEDFSTDFFVGNNIKPLVTIGGDDAASTAVRVSNYLKTQNLDVATIHVPKTIDNDLPLPHRNPTFGFHSAKDQGVKLGSIIAEDARTPQSRLWKRIFVSLPLQSLKEKSAIFIMGL